MYHHDFDDPPVRLDGNVTVGAPDRSVSFTFCGDDVEEAWAQLEALLAKPGVSLEVSGYLARRVNELEAKLAVYEPEPQEDD